MHSAAYIRSLELDNAVKGRDPSQPQPLLFEVGSVLAKIDEVNCKHGMLSLTLRTLDLREQQILIPIDSPFAVEILEKYGVLQLNLV